MALSSRLQAIVDTILGAHPDGLTLDELSDALSTQAVSYGDIDEIIGAVESAGVDLEAAAPSATPEDLVRVLASARALSAQTGKRPTPEDIARHLGIAPTMVRRALRLGGAVDKSQTS